VQAAQNDRWWGGTAYDRFMGRWSRLIAARFIDWLEPQPGLAWLDVGCGTGALTSTIVDMASPVSVTGIDPSGPFIEAARSSVGDARARFEIADAREIPLDDQTVDLAVSGLCLNFVPEPERAVAEMTRVARPGGRVAAYVWDYLGGMQMLGLFWEAAARIDPEAAAARDEGSRFVLAAPGPLRSLFEGAGLHSVEVVDIQADTVFRDFADYWTPFEAGTGPAPAFLLELSEDGQTVLKEELRASLPVETDGSIHLTARAWAACGTR
jgi:SAM-dependent methyltransferase